MRATRTLTVVTLFSVLLSACGGGAGTTSLPAAGGGGSTPTQQTQNAVDGANAAGAPVQDVSTFENTVNDPTLPLSAAIATQGSSVASGTPAPGTSPAPSASPSTSPTPRPTPPPMGTCISGTFPGLNGSIKGFEYWKPDRAGDPNSREYAFFYDAACTQTASDRTRVYTITGTAPNQTENLQVTVLEYKQGSTVPSSALYETSTISGTFNGEGYPSSGSFARSSSYKLYENGDKTTGTLVAWRGGEHIASLKSGALTFCADSAGINPKTISSLGLISGWQNLIAQATRTQTGATVTYTVNNVAGSSYSGPAGSMTPVQGTLNAACPIVTPAWTLSGGSKTGSSGTQSMSVSLTNGVVSALSIVNMTFGANLLLNAQSNAGVAPTSTSFVTGTITQNGASVATFSVDANGNGTLTTAAGKTFTMTHWHVSHENTASPSPSPSPSASSSPAPGVSPTPTATPH